jgi:hypothetical protein
MIAGSSFHYFEVGRSGRTIYRLRVSEHTSQRFVPATDNVTPIVMAGATRCAYVNRLAAFYRHMAGRPTDSEPPAAR